MIASILANTRRNSLKTVDELHRLANYRTTRALTGSAVKHAGTDQHGSDDPCHLAAPGSDTNLELADRVGMSPTTAGDRLRRLVKDRLITGFGARLDPTRLGVGLLVFVEVPLDKTTPDAFDHFAAAVWREPEVLECHMVAGGFNYLLKTRVRDMAAYREFLGEFLLTFPGIRETRTYAVMEEVKTDGPLPV